MWEKIKAFFGAATKGTSDYLAAHPLLKNLINGFINAVLSAAVGYLGAAMDPVHATQFTMGGFGLAIMGAVKAYQQQMHDVVLANLQDQIQNLSKLQGSPVATVASALDTTPTKSSALTPIDVPTKEVPVAPEATTPNKA